MTTAHAPYADWDAAYVLGSLSPAERLEFETHLEGCGRCRASVAELSGLPGLLARLDADRAFELIEHRDEAPTAESAPIATLPADLVARIQARQAARSGRRTRLLLGLAAAAVVATAIAIPVSIASAPIRPCRRRSRRWSAARSAPTSSSRPWAGEPSST